MAVVVLPIAVATSLREWVFGDLGRGLPFILFFPCVLLAAVYGGLTAGILSTLVSAGVVFFWIQSGHPSAAEAFAMGVFLVSSTFVCFLARRMQIIVARATESERLALKANQDLREEVSKRSQAEAAERESRQSLHQTLDAAGVGFWKLDLVSNLAERSQTYERMFGYAEERNDWSFERFLEHVIPEDRAQVRQSFDEGIAQGGEWNFECRIRREDGQVRWIWGHGRVFIGPSGTPERMLGMVSDITDRKQGEAELKQSEERFRRAVVNAPFPIMIHAEDGRVLQLSNAWCEISEYSPAELGTIEEWCERAYGVRRTLLVEEIEQLYGLTSRKDEGDYEIRVKGGTQRIWQFSSAPLGILSDGRRAVISMALDVTDRRLAEAQVRELNDELEARVAKRTAELEASNQELEAFSYSVSHDLRAPLRAVDSFSRMVMEDYGPVLEGEGRRQLEVVRSEAQRMGRLIDDLLRFSRIGRQSMSLDSFDSESMVQGVFAELKALTQAQNVQLVLEALPSGYGDKSLLRQVWVNLISNAIKFSAVRNDPRIEVGAESQAGETIFRVRDNGGGFDPRFSEKLFKVFQRLHSEDEFEGTGVGLALVHRIISRHGGRVWAESALGEGACFFFSLPTLNDHAIT